MNKFRIKNYYIAFRKKYTPNKIKAIFVLESPPNPPKLGKYFYKTNGRVSEPLFAEMMNLIHYKPLSKKAGLKEFQKRGFVIVDAVYMPINHLDEKSRNKEILRWYPILLKDLKKLTKNKNTPIILVKANICRLLEKWLSIEFNVINKGVIIPFPSTGNQKRFRNQIAKLLNIV